MFNIEKTVLESMYVVEKKSMAAIGEIIGCNPNTVMTSLIRLGIPRRGRYDTSAKREAISARAEHGREIKAQNTWKSRHKAWGEWNTKFKMSREELEDLYLNSTLTLGQIADKSGVCFGTVLRKLKDFGIDRGRRLSKKCPHRKRTYEEMAVIWARQDTSNRDERRWRHHSRLVWEYYHGEKLTRNDAIHHIDHNFRNCDPSNLQKMTRSEHGKLHMAERKKENGRLLPIDIPKNK